MTLIKPMLQLDKTIQDSRSCGLSAEPKDVDMDGCTGADLRQNFGNVSNVPGDETEWRVPTCGKAAYVPVWDAAHDSIHC
jgi:hypothetical protein